MAVDGTCDPRFERVRATFEKSFETGEVGAAVAVTLGGELVVDLHGGFADAERTRPWQRDTIANTYSTTKGMTAICANRLIDAGKLDVDAPVARYWPEFAQAGKANMPVRYLLNHKAGLAGVRKPLAQGDLYAWDTMCAALAETEPWWEPGTQHGYHALTFGHLVGEVIRRVDGRSVGNYFREELAQPLGLDFRIGTPASEHARIAEIIPAPAPANGAPDTFQRFAQDPNSVTFAAFNNPTNRRNAVNTKEWREAEIPAANGHGDARSLARIYGALAGDGRLDGVRVLSPAAILRARKEESLGKDSVLGFPTRFGLGFMLRHQFLPLGPNPNSFGHPGAGGSIAFADPDRGLGIGYVMNQMQEGLAGDPRGWKLIDAVYKSLA